MSQEGFDLVSLLPLVITQIPIWIICIRLARRKGLSVPLYASTGWIPLLNLFYVSYLVGLTDREVYDKLDAIMARLGDGEAPSSSQRQ